MHTAFTIAGVTAVGLSSALGGPSLSPVLRPVESRFTELSGATCAADRPYLSCPGLGGARVLVFRDRGEAVLGFGGAGSRGAHEILRGWDPAAGSAEWRGVSGFRGFDPHAVLVRMRAPGPSASEAGSAAILRTSGGRACLVATVALAPGGGMDRARALADGPARHLPCLSGPGR